MLEDDMMTSGDDTAAAPAAPIEEAAPEMSEAPMEAAPEMEEAPNEAAPETTEAPTQEAPETPVEETPSF